MSLDFNSVLGDSEVPFDCPQCGKTLKVKLGDVGRKSVKCGNCGSTVNVNPDKSFKSSTKSVDKSLKDFEKSLKNFGK